MIMKSVNKTLIFDFDGTIADSFETFVRTLEEVLSKSQNLSENEIENLRGLSLRDIIKQLGITKWQLPKVIYRGRRLMAERTSQVEIFDGIQDAIHKLSRDYDLYILSTGSKSAIESFLARYELQDYFKSIIGDVGISGKARSITKLIKINILSKVDCIYIGDETRDIKAARKAGIKILSVGWGFNNVAALESEEPDSLILNPQDLVAKIDIIQDY